MLERGEEAASVMFPVDLKAGPNERTEKDRCRRVFTDFLRRDYGE